MYWISNRQEANTLVQQAKDTETKIKSQCIKEDETKKKNIYNEEGREILENIEIIDLMSYNKATIIYSKTNLNEELDLIIEKYNYIPEIMNHRYTVTQIKFNKDDKDIILVLDPNLEFDLTFKDVRKFCIKAEIELIINHSVILSKSLKNDF